MEVFLRVFDLESVKKLKVNSNDEFFKDLQFCKNKVILFEEELCVFVRE